MSWCSPGGRHSTGCSCSQAMGSSIARHGRLCTARPGGTHPSRCMCLRRRWSAGTRQTHQARMHVHTRQAGRVLVGALASVLEARHRRHSTPHSHGRRATQQQKANLHGKLQQHGKCQRQARCPCTCLHQLCMQQSLGGATCSDGSSIIEHSVATASVAASKELHRPPRRDHAGCVPAPALHLSLVVHAH